ncbi:hypothetical protein VXQ18_06740 [Brucella abortus]|nr:hypothetical protein [Brucella abortus]
MSHLGGNTISVNGVAILGWFGVWTLTLRARLGGFGFRADLGSGVQWRLGWLRAMSSKCSRD